VLEDPVARISSAPRQETAGLAPAVLFFTGHVHDRVNEFSAVTQAKYFFNRRRTKEFLFSVFARQRNARVRCEGGVTNYSIAPNDLFEIFPVIYCAARAYLASTHGAFRSIAN